MQETKPLTISAFLKDTVPVMMDESIYGLADIDIAGAIAGIGFVKLKLTTMALTFLLIVGLVLAFAGVLILPGVLAVIPLGGTAELLLSGLRWVLLLGFTVLAVALIYHFGPDRRPARWRWVTPGAAIACLLWIVTSVGFSIYAENFGSYQETFGSLAGVVILLFLTLGQVGGLTKATEQLKEMTPPETGIGIVTLGLAHTETTTLPKGGWLRLSDGGIARLAEQASLAKGETRTEAKLLKITTPAEVDRIEPTDFGFTVTATFTADETKGYGSGRKGVYVSAPGPHPEREDGFLNVWIAISFFFFWAFGSAGQPSNMVRLMAFKGTNVLRNAILAVSVYYTVIYLLLVVIFCCARILLPGMEVDSDRIMPELAAKVTGDAGVPWLAGLLLAAPFAAVMSSVDSFLLMVSSAVVRDIYQNRVNPNASEKRLKRLSYLVTAVVGILAMLAVLNPPQYLQDLIVFATSGLAGCFLMPVLLGLYWPQITAKGAIAGMLGGLSCHLSLYIAGYLIEDKFVAFKLLEFDPFIWSLVVSGLLCWGVSPSQAKSPKNI